jgi:hypothetical protein
MPSGSFTTGVTSTANGPLSISQFYSTPPSTPGSVGVCLSGGGSRALTAGMGQLRALSFLAANGKSLLSQVKALSTVSGGSWLGVPYTFLPAGAASDASYLGTYNSNQGNLTTEQLAQLPAGNAGVPMNSFLFSPEGLAIEAYLLWEFLNVPESMLWQTVIALNILIELQPLLDGFGFESCAERYVFLQSNHRAGRRNELQQPAATQPFAGAGDDLSPTRPALRGLRVRS